MLTARQRRHDHRDIPPDATWCVRYGPTVSTMLDGGPIGMQDLVGRQFASFGLRGSDGEGDCCDAGRYPARHTIRPPDGPSPCRSGR